MSVNILVEPNCVRRYPCLALMKISTERHRQGDCDVYVKGNRTGLPDDPRTLIYISTLFTYELDKTLACIDFYHKHYPKNHIFVGGIVSTLCPDKFEGRWDDRVHLLPGTHPGLDACPPNYKLVPVMANASPYIKRWLDYSILFTTRGCVRKCDFCAVHRLEPKHHIIPNWREHIDLTKKHVMVQDNNLTSFSVSHFEQVMEFIQSRSLRACFNNGFDARLMSPAHMDILAKTKWDSSGLRLAFDNMSEDGPCQAAIEGLLSRGVVPSAIMVFCMFNHRDTLDEAMYRCREVSRLGVRPYPIPYRPLDETNPTAHHISPNWTPYLVRTFRSYWMFGGNWRHISWEDYYSGKQNCFQREVAGPSGDDADGRVAEGAQVAEPPDKAC